MSPRGKQKSKNARSASAARGSTNSTSTKTPAKKNENRFGAPHLVVAILLIGAIVLAVGYTMRQQSRVESEAVYQMAPEPPNPPAADNPAPAPSAATTQANQQADPTNTSPQQPSTN
jgi:hypothetical protein